MNIHYIYGAVLKIKSKSNKFKKCQITLKHCLRITTIGYRSSLATTLTWKVIIKRPFMHDLSCIIFFCLLSGAGRLGAAVWAPPFGRRRLGAAVWAHRRLGAGRLGAGPYARGNRIL